VLNRSRPVLRRRAVARRHEASVAAQPPDARWMVADCLTFGAISLSGPHAGQYTPLPVIPGGNSAPYPAW
jgi:hypothetical protein